MSHTPGPWRAMGLCIESEKHGNIGLVNLARDSQSDARLISAAPDLLDALRGILDRYTSLVDSGDCGFWDAGEEAQVIAARAAIAKATQP